MNHEYILVLTPYLEKILGTTTSIESENSSIDICGPNYSGEEKNREALTFRGTLAQAPILAIAGSTRGGEDEVRGLKGTGIIVARYSIFYGRPSEYTGSSPEEAGYSLDFPKNINTVRSMLRNGDVLEALRSRNKEGIEKALEIFNECYNAPIRTTPYLEIATQENVGKN